MNPKRITAVLRGQDKGLNDYLDSLVDVPEEYKRLSGVPAWSSKGGIKRNLFKWMSKLGKTHIYMSELEDGVIGYRITAPFFNEWRFVMTPEQVYLASRMIDALTTLRSAESDITFEWKNYTMFVPAELVGKFHESMLYLLQRYGERLNQIHSVIHSLAYATHSATMSDDKESQEGKPKRVLH